MQKKSFLTLIVFLLANFAALAIGSWLAGNPVTNEWYNSVDKAPWTPPGWIFGAAWFSIMLLFSIFLWNMQAKIDAAKNPMFYAVFALQFVLNVVWNPIFFAWHLPLPGLIVIVLLSILVGGYLVWGFRKGGLNGLYMLPYFIWMCIATSLNAYILINL